VINLPTKKKRTLTNRKVLLLCLVIGLVALALFLLNSDLFQAPTVVDTGASTQSTTLTTETTTITSGSSIVTIDITPEKIATKFVDLKVFFARMVIDPASGIEREGYWLKGYLQTVDGAGVSVWGWMEGQPLHLPPPRELKVQWSMLLGGSVSRYTKYVQTRASDGFFQTYLCNAPYDVSCSFSGSPEYLGCDFAPPLPPALSVLGLSQAFPISLPVILVVVVLMVVVVCVLAVVLSPKRSKRPRQ